MGIALPQYGIATTDAKRLTRSLKHTMSTYCMINRTETLAYPRRCKSLRTFKTDATTLISRMPTTARSLRSPAYSRRFS